MELVQRETNAAVIPEKPQTGFTSLAMERHYTVGELSKLWFFSENTIRRMFIHEPGVIKISRQATRVKRGYADPEYPDRSALIFAPEEPAIDDGLLQVREIRRLRLDANLVTLSACDTGVGPVGEEGVANIVNAFIEAGARSVVSTLWELEDHATAHLMTVFYEHLGRHEEKEEALRQAQLEMMNSGAPPYYWASFELDGEPSGSLFKETRTTIPSRSTR